MKIVVGVTGASGAPYAYRTLAALVKADVEVHLVASHQGREIFEQETGIAWSKFESLAYRCYDIHDLGASIASGSFRHDGMVIVPCSVKTLGAIAAGLSDNLLVRAADVCLKERRRLVLAVRETPLSYIHLDNMMRVTQAGGIILPASPGFYHNPKDIGHMIDFVAGKILDVLGVPNELFERWSGN